MEEISKLKCLLSNTNKQQKFSININLYGISLILNTVNKIMYT